MPLRDLAFASLIVLSLAGCTTRTASSPAPAAPEAAPGVALPVAPVQDAEGTPGPASERLGREAADPSRRCATDSDCAVKDVGNCCGYFPMCVNKDARTDPAAVRAQCEKDGMSSICGFQEISGCQCVAGRCESLAEGAVVK